MCDELPGAKPLSRDMIYNTYVQFMMHADNLSWNRLYNLLTVEGLLGVIWGATIDKNGFAMKIAGALTALMGWWLGVFWSRLLRRGRVFLEAQVKAGMEYESGLVEPTPFSLTRALQEESFRSGRIFTSTWIQRNTPLALAELHCLVLPVYRQHLISCGISGGSTFYRADTEIVVALIAMVFLMLMALAICVPAWESSCVKKDAAP